MGLLSDLLDPGNLDIADLLGNTLGDLNHALEGVDLDQFDGETDSLIKDAAALLGLDSTSLIDDLSKIDFSGAIDYLKLLGDGSNSGNIGDRLNQFVQDLLKLPVANQGNTVGDLLDKSIKDLVPIIVTVAGRTKLGDLLNQSVQDLLNLPVAETGGTIGDLLDKSAKDLLDTLIATVGDADIHALIDKSLKDILHLPVDSLIDPSILNQPIQDLLATVTDTIGDTIGDTTIGDLLDTPIDHLLDPLFGEEADGSQNGDRSLEQSPINSADLSLVNTGESVTEPVKQSVDQDTLLGTNDNDILLGSKNDDILNGGKGNDTLKGGGGNDILIGGKGRDRLWGGQGLDRLIGGSGNDIFVLKANNELDTIEDFQNGRDRLSLSGGVDFDRLSILQKGRNTLIKLDGKPLALLEGIAASQISAQDFTGIRI
jgi:RTX calcium-binding nonapeptide repeat (4 copies)